MEQALADNDEPMETPGPWAPLGEPPGEPRREPLFNIPWPVMTLFGVLLAAFAVQSLFGVDALADRYGFRPTDLSEGRFETMVTSLFLHGGWPHVLMNAGFLVAFGTPVSRRFGLDARGVAGFFVFYMVCGVLANLGYAALNPGSADPVIGASGAVSGLMGAGSRLLWRRGADLAPFNSQPVVSLAAAWVLINVLFGAVLKGWTPGSGGAPVAWQAHLVGFAVGLFLLSPALQLIGRRSITA